ncbi:MAG: M50 family metallopeptidase [Sandaracinaceae bacterium]|nr:M50 family metallopeptidase [Sandaracinaceae bacterium]
MASFSSYLIAILGITLLVVVHETGHYLAARFFGMRVLRYSLGFGPVLLKHQPKGSPTVFQISAIPILAYVQIDGMNPAEDNDPNDPALYCNQSVWARLLVILAGPFANYLAASAIVFGLYAVKGIPELDPNGPMIINYVHEGSPAAKAGLRPGDAVVMANGVPIHRVEELVAVTKDRAGVPTEYRIQRDGKLLDPIIITPIEQGGRGVIGITGGPTIRYTKASLPQLLWLSIERPFTFTLLQVQGIAEMIKRRSLEGLSGPTQMVRMVAEQAKHGWEDYVQILFAISVALGFFNLLPIPALDGGRALFLLFEIVSRRKINAKFETTATLVGLVVLVALIIFVSIRG